MSKTYNAVVHPDFLKDLNGLDGSLRKKAQNKIRAIADNTWGYEGHELSGDLRGFRSADFEGRLYKIIFSYCKECREVGRNPDYVGICPECDTMGDNFLIFWRIDRHRGGDQDGYRLVSRDLNKKFPPKAA